MKPAATRSYSSCETVHGRLSSNHVTLAIQVNHFVGMMQEIERIKTQKEVQPLSPTPTLHTLMHKRFPSPKSRKSLSPLKSNEHSVKKSNSTTQLSIIADLPERPKTPLSALPTNRSPTSSLPTATGYLRRKTGITSVLPPLHQHVMLEWMLVGEQGATPHERRQNRMTWLANKKESLLQKLEIYCDKTIRADIVRQIEEIEAEEGFDLSPDQEVVERYERMRKL